MRTISEEIILKELLTTQQGRLGRITIRVLETTERTRGCRAKEGLDLDGEGELGKLVWYTPTNTLELNDKEQSRQSTMGGDKRRGW